MKKITTKLQKALNERYTIEQQDAFAWYVDEETPTYYRWRFYDHKQQACVLTYMKNTGQIGFASKYRGAL